MIASYQDILLVLAGLVLLFAGGELLVRGAVSAARRFGVSELVIGITIVGFGTSTPELLVSVEAALKNSAEIALGNVVGSNIANILLIGGVAALISPLRDWDRSVNRDTGVMLAATLLLLAAALYGAIPFWLGAIMLASLCIYLYWTYRMATAAGVPEVASEPAEPAKAPPSLFVAIALVAIGLGLLFLGANWLVDGATSIARALGVSEAVIGLTIVAVGTSLPELATSIVAAWRGSAAVSIGNIVGSNIFNILGILGITAMIAPLPIAERFLVQEIPIALASGILIAALLFFANRIGRMSGLVAIALYGAYTLWLFQVPA